MNKFLYILTMLTVFFPIMGQDFNFYDIQIVKRINMGSESGQIQAGYIAPGLLSPSASIFISDKMYINDSLNQKLLVFSDDLNLEKEIKLLTYSFYERFFRQINSEVLVGTDYHDVTYINLNGEELADVNLHKINSNYKSFSAIGFENIVFGWTEDGEIFSIINPSSDQTQNKNNYKNPEETRRLFEAGSDFELPEGLSLDSEDMLNMNNEILSFEFRDFTKFWYNKDTSHWRSPKHAFLAYNSPNMYYLGRDQDRNWYWFDHPNKILVFSGNGIVLDIFSFDLSNITCNPAIHPSGDIYFISYDEEYVLLSKIERRW
jgi:hypothetical protein